MSPVPTAATLIPISDTQRTASLRKFTIHSWTHKLLCTLLGASLTGYVAAPVLSQTLTTLANFNSTDGREPFAGLVQGSDGNFYGTTNSGGSSTNCGGGCGTVFKMTPAGIVTTLVSFDFYTTGGYPNAGLVQGSNGNFYGTTYAGASSGQGSVFQVTPSGIFTTLVQFTYTNGGGPSGGLVQGSDGNFYGTTYTGGSFGGGTVFRMTPSGALTTLVNFNGSNGSSPDAELVQASDGNFYGTTFFGGSAGDGTVFKMTPVGALTTLVSFKSSNGSFPRAGLVQGGDGNFYGTTQNGGSSTVCGRDPFTLQNNGCGTVFRITPAGLLTTLVSFNFDNGRYPFGTLAQGSDGNFYGTTSQGGDSDVGTVFQITPAGTLTTLLDFNDTNGSFPYAGLIRGGDGNFYGTTFSGGSSTSCFGHGCGTVFQLNPAVSSPTLASFSPAFGIVNTAVTLTGGNFIGTTAVTFNGKAASFVVNNGNSITAQVPILATSGPIAVTNASGTATSLTNFSVLPFIQKFSPTSGPVGLTVNITGTGFFNVTAVTFNGVPATSFTVQSVNKISARVPVGATTGPIRLVTGAGSYSKGTFTVIP